MNNYSIKQYRFEDVVKRWAWLVGLLFIVLIATNCGPYSPFADLLIPTESIQVYVPEGYEGRILIAWQVPDSTVAEKEEGVWQYRLQEDGALLLQNDAPESVLWSFSYERADGILEPIPSSTCFDTDKEEGIVVCTGMIAEVHNGYDFRPNASFTITMIDDYLNRKWSGEEYFHLYDRYLDELKLPDG